MTAREYFEGLSDAVRRHRRAELLLEYGPARPACPAGGGSVEGPTMARAASNEAARRAMERAEEEIGEGLERIEWLRRIFSRKADAIELRYVDLMPWHRVAEEIGVDSRTARRWHDELLDWVDSFGWARVRLGVGIAEDSAAYGRTPVDGAPSEC